MGVLLTFKMIYKNILETYFSVGNLSPFFLCCRVWPSRERENAPQHPTSFHCGSQHEGCKVCRLPGHCAFRTSGCHLFRFLSFEIIFSAVYHCLFEDSWYRRWYLLFNKSNNLFDPSFLWPQSVTPCATLNARPVFRPRAVCLLSMPLTSQKLCAEKRQTPPRCRSKRPVGTFAWRDGWSSLGNLKPPLFITIHVHCMFYSTALTVGCVYVTQKR